MNAEPATMQNGPKVRVSVQTQDFSLDELFAEVSADSCGAVDVFVGSVREFGEGSNVVALELSHYPGMTQSVLEKAAHRVAAEFDLQALVVVHRVGRLEVGERIVAVVAASAHRTQAFDGCRAMMERLKSDAPFWKKEWLNDGSSVWVRGKHA